MDVEKLQAYEHGELDARQTLELFAQLIRTGTAWYLQGHYGRAADRYIRSGLIDRAGRVRDTQERAA